MDDAWHKLGVPLGDVLYVYAKEPGMVSFWTIADTDRMAQVRSFRVFATGQPLPLEAGRYLGTAVDGPLVWHLFEYI